MNKDEHTSYCLSSDIVRFDSKGTSKPMCDLVVEETQFRIMVNGGEFLVASILPDMQREFTLGILHGSGLISKPGDLLGCEIDYDRGIAFVELLSAEPPSEYASKPTFLGSACGSDPITVSTNKLSPLSPNVKVASESISNAALSLYRNATLFKETGGVHSVGLYDSEGKELVRADDIGRHNAFDKVMGAILTQGTVDPSQCFAVCTGRLSSEIAIKSWRAGIPILVSKSCATTRAVDIAKDANITLIGFARGKRFNVYSHAGLVIAGSGNGW